MQRAGGAGGQPTPRVKGAGLRSGPSLVASAVKSPRGRSPRSAPSPKAPHPTVTRPRQIPRRSVWDAEASHPATTRPKQTSGVAVHGQRFDSLPRRSGAETVGLSGPGAVVEGAEVQPQGMTTVQQLKGELRELLGHQFSLITQQNIRKLIHWKLAGPMPNSGNSGVPVAKAAMAQAASNSGSTAPLGSSVVATPSVPIVANGEPAALDTSDTSNIKEMAAAPLGVESIFAEQQQMLLGQFEMERQYKEPADAQEGNEANEAQAMKRLHEDSQGDALVQVFPFSLGDAVFVWSSSQNCWCKDGVVTRVEDGCLEVVYDSERSSKVLNLDQARMFLQKVGDRVPANSPVTADCAAVARQTVQIVLSKVTQDLAHRMHLNGQVDTAFCAEERSKIWQAVFQLQVKNLNGKVLAVLDDVCPSWSGADVLNRLTQEVPVNPPVFYKLTCNGVVLTRGLTLLQCGLDDRCNGTVQSIEAVTVLNHESLALQRAAENIFSNPFDVEEMIAMQCPPQEVMLIVRALGRLYDVPASGINDHLDWATAKRSFLESSEELAGRLKGFDADKDPAVILSKLDPFIANDHFTPESVGKVSLCAKHLVEWCHVLHRYCQIVA